ncbi:MAG: hypothetical protein HQK53_18040 [Oligoflexia bacterium]|nr:hypothetical protein [Oligoflexia bacterium]
MKEAPISTTAEILADATDLADANITIDESIVNAETDPTALNGNLRNFRHSHDVENFYRFVYEHDLRREAKIIFDHIMTYFAKNKKKRKNKVSQ